MRHCLSINPSKLHEKNTFYKLHFSDTFIGAIVLVQAFLSKVFVSEMIKSFFIKFTFSKLSWGSLAENCWPVYFEEGAIFFWTKLQCTLYLINYSEIQFFYCSLASQTSDIAASHLFLKLPKCSLLYRLNFTFFYSVRSIYARRVISLFKIEILSVSMYLLHPTCYWKIEINFRKRVAVFAQSKIVC